MKIRELAEMSWDSRIATLRDMTPAERKELAGKLELGEVRDYLDIQTAISRLKGYLILMKPSRQEQERFWTQFEERNG